jgi:hypothetical protein
VHSLRRRKTIKFNTSFLAEPQLLSQMQEQWNAAPRPTPGDDRWQEWVAAALERVKVFCQETGRTRATEKMNMEQQLRARVASAEKLLESHPTSEFLFDKLHTASQELMEKEQTDIEWATIRSSAKWAQIEGRMTSDFFTNVSAALSSTPIQLLRDQDGQEYSSNDEMARYANSYFQELFASQGESAECLRAREQVWKQVPRKVSSAMNEALTAPITIAELHTAMKLLPTGKASGPDGFQVDFFLVMWDTIGNDILEVCQSALNSGTLHRDLNIGTLCLLPKGGDKTSLRNWRPITLLGSVYKCIAKLLARRIQPWLMQLVRPNQTGFMKGRSIIDNVFLAIEAMEWATETNQPMVMLLLDFEKAYDRVEWGFLEGTLNKLGFNSTWISWV